MGPASKPIPRRHFRCCRLLTTKPRNRLSGFSATACGDIGGFGIGAHIDRQVAGTIDYAINSWVDPHHGLRSLNFSYGARRADIQMNLFGPVLAATFRFSPYERVSHGECAKPKQTNDGRHAVRFPKDGPRANIQR
jgi:hypothetical protein